MSAGELSKVIELSSVDDCVELAQQVSLAVVLAHARTVPLNVRPTAATGPLLRYLVSASAPCATNQRWGCRVTAPPGSIDAGALISARRPDQRPIAARRSCARKAAEAVATAGSPVSSSARPTIVGPSAAGLLNSSRR